MIIFDAVEKFYKGRARVKLNGKWGHINKKGNITTPIIYDFVSDFCKDRAVVGLDGKWGYVDKDGNTIKEKEYMNKYDLLG